MSAWLRNVNAILENLDAKAEETVVDRYNAHEDDEVEESFLEEDTGVNDILAKRGLLEECDGADTGGGDAVVEEGTSDVSEEVIDFDGEKAEDVSGEEIKVDESAYSSAKQSDDKGEGSNETSSQGAASNDDGTTPEDTSSDNPHQKAEGTTLKESTSAPSSTNAQASAPPPSNQSASSPKPTATNTPPAPPTAAQNKELRKLRRHIHQLNSSLETAEREIEAQRAELERAASRIERDRSRSKQEKESAEASHKAEVSALIAAHEKSMQNYKELQEVKVKEMEGRILRAEQARAREGGERDAELAEALDRERGAIENVAALTEEKNTLVERVTTLSAEISRLEMRLENASSQFELASERERNAEEQLDKVLSLHARQLGIRQKRESELEQTVADLGAALVVAKNKIEKDMASAAAVKGREDEEGLKERFADCQDEVETLRVQLTLERQRCETLHGELQNLSKEQADELSGAHARQRQYERKISDLTTTVAKLHGTLKRSNVGEGDTVSFDESSEYAAGSEEYGGASLQHSGDEKKETDHLRKQIASLSEKIFEQQSKLDRSSAEISTFKTRLQSAILRAETAEKSLESANQRLIMMGTPHDGGYAVSGMSSADEEMGIGRRKKGVGKRRYPTSDPARRGFQRSSKVESIRSALGLNPGRIHSGGCQETMAVILDTCDTVAIDMGSHFRHYPLSRLLFIFYLVILHAWAFFLLVYHAHAQGTGGLDHYSPESMLMSYRHAEQVPGGVLAQIPKLDEVPNLHPAEKVDQGPNLGQAALNQRPKLAGGASP